MSANSSRRHFIGLFPDLAGLGGVQESSRLIALAVQSIAKEQGWTVDFLSLNGAPGSHSLVFEPDTIRFRGFDRSKIRFVLAALGCARHSPNRERTVVLAAHPNLAPVAALVRRTARNAKTIVVAHGIEAWTRLPAVRRRALAAANLILVPSRFTAEKTAAAQNIAAEKIRRLPWPLSPSFFALAQSREGLRLPEGFPRGRVVLTVGRWAASERYKGADELVSSMRALAAEFPDLRLVAIGGGDDLPRLRQLASNLGIGDRVHFLEGLSREQVAACYAHADIFALPSTGEGFGLVFLEAMAFSKPIVAAATGGVTDVIEDGVNGLLVPPDDAAAVCSALEKLLRGPALGSRLGESGARKIRETYSFERFKKELQQLVGRLMDSPLS